MTNQVLLLIFQAISILFPQLTVTAMNSVENQAIDHTRDHELRTLIRTHNLTGNPAQSVDIPSINSPEAQLGMRLFFSSGLSGNRDTACATCHHPTLGGGDNLSLSIGSGTAKADSLSHQRKTWNAMTPGVPRNASTTFNSALWQRVIFYDGRIERLPGEQGITTPDMPYPKADPRSRQLIEAQARFPLTSVHEMRGHYFADTSDSRTYRIQLAQRLGGYGPIGHMTPASVSDYWLNAFRIVFNAPDAPASVLINPQTISSLLADYQNSQLFIDNPWNRYVQGDNDAISPEAKAGALLFYRPVSQGGFACYECHRGDFFTDENFHNRLIPPVGPGKQPTWKTLKGLDRGRQLTTHQSGDAFRFRTPSLLNVEVTGPWGHNGAYTELSAMVRHAIQPHRSVLTYDGSQLKQPGVQTTYLKAGLEVLLEYGTPREQEFTETDLHQLTAFLNTLTDPCVKDRQCMGTWIPADNQPDLLHTNPVDWDVSLYAKP